MERRILVVDESELTGQQLSLLLAIRVVRSALRVT